VADRHDDVPFQSFLREHGIDIAARIALHRNLKMAQREIAVEVETIGQIGVIAAASADEVLFV
jgi:hypothetical protein